MVVRCLLTAEQRAFKKGKVIHDLHGASHYEDFLFIEGKCSDYI